MNVTLIKKVDGRINRSTGLKITTGLRVTAYCRVSTDGEDQKNSYESQKSYYKEKITSNSEWKYVGIYADEAISGTLDYKRNDFMRIIQDALDNKFDMIMTKSISRFARNTVDTLKYVRLLKEHNVAVFFEEEGINTLEMSGELLLTILSSVAQQESENTSTHVKLGLKMKKERGELIGFGGCLGYTYNSEENTLTINEDEAKIVRLIYSKYLEGYGAESISRQLTREGIKSPKGKDVWCETTIRKILKNEKYKGDVLQGKTFTIDHINHKRLSNMGEEDKYYISNHHEAIIDEETFEKVQQIMKERNECNKLLDYMLDGTIDKTTYAEKKEDCLAKIKEIDTQITKIKDTIEDDDSVERGLRKFKKVFDDNTIMEEFDIDVFDALVDYIIVGGYNESGRADPYMLRFIVKTRSNILKKEEDVSKEHIVERSKLTEDYKNFVLLDFIDKQNFIAYDRDKERNFKKRIIKKVRVRVECDMNSQN